MQPDEIGKSEASKTDLFNVAKEKPIRPVTTFFLILFGSITIVCTVIGVIAAFALNDAIAGVLFLSAAILVVWCGIAFLWHSVRQIIAKIDALTEVTERVRKQVDHLDTLVR